MYLTEKEILKKVELGGCIVSSAQCSEIEIALARCCDRMCITKEGMGYIYFPKGKVLSSDNIVEEPKEETHY